MLRTATNNSFNEEEKAWKKLQKGSTRALGYFYDKYVEDLFKFGVSLGFSKEVVEDAIHELFISIFKYHPNLISPDNIKSYLLISFKRTLLKTSKLHFIPMEKLELDKKLEKNKNYFESTESKIIEFEESLNLKKEFNSIYDSLTHHQREVLDLKFNQNKSYKEISKDLNITISSARTVVYRSIKELRKKASLLFL